MQVLFLGYVHRQGNRKSDGKPYDFFEVHFALPKTQYSVGCTVEKKIIPTLDTNVSLPCLAEVSCDLNGRVVEFRPFDEDYLKFFE